MSKTNNDEHRVRTLVEYDIEGRDRSTHIVHDFRGMLRDAFPELNEEHEKRQTEKQPAELIPLKPSK